MKKTVFITGASRGVGNSIANKFEKEGYQIVAPSRAELDLSSPDSIHSYLSKNSSLAPDILINNAGENKPTPIANVDLELWNRILTTNTTSCFLLIQKFAPLMAEKNWGRIVNLSSCYSILSRIGRAPYSASKAALNALTRTTALEYGARGVLANAVAPGFIGTEMTFQNNTKEQIEALQNQTALKRMATPEEIAEFVFFLASEKNTYITGQTLLIDGGFAIQ